MLSERERLTALINNMREWTPGSGAYHLEEEDIPIVVEALMKLQISRTMKEFAGKE